MADYSINRGIGKSVEFKGLKAQYLFIFVGGLLAIFILFVLMYLAGVNQWFCIITGCIGTTILVYQTFALNAKYGEYGLMKKQALSYHPRYIINRRSLFRLFKNKHHEK